MVILIIIGAVVFTGFGYVVGLRRGFHFGYGLGFEDAMVSLVVESIKEDTRNEDPV